MLPCRGIAFLGYDSREKDTYLRITSIMRSIEFVNAQDKKMITKEEAERTIGTVGCRRSGHRYPTAGMDLLQIIKDSLPLTSQLVRAIRRSTLCRKISTPEHMASLGCTWGCIRDNLSSHIRP